MRNPATLWLLSVILAAGFHSRSASAQNPVRIMPLGNSITEGYTDGSLTNEQMRGYRYGLRYLLKNYGYTLDFVGSQTGGSAYFSDCQHAGIGGTRDQYLVTLLTTGYDERNGVQILLPPRNYLDEYNPDIILLHVGTNDITHEGTAALANQKVTDILNLVDQYEVRAGKDVVVFLALIINRVKPWNPGSPAEITSSFNNGIKSMALSRIAAGDKIVIVDMEKNAGFEYTYLTDMAVDGEGLHPNEFGYSKMANLWYSSIIANYNTPPDIASIPDQAMNEGNNALTLTLDNYVSDVEDPVAQLTWSALQLGTANLNLSINGSRQLIATPKNPDWNGTQTVVLTVTDLGKNGKYIKSDRDTLTITVTPVNDAPVITSTPLLTAETGSMYTYTLTATDVDHTVLYLSAVSKPAWLSFSESSGMLWGTPATSDQGQNPVILRASDGNLYTDQSFTILVDSPDPIPGHETSGVYVYPVPARDFLVVVSEMHSAALRLEIINSSGMVCKGMIIPPYQRNYQLDTGDLANGLYHYRLTGASTIFTGKFYIYR